MQIYWPCCILPIHGLRGHTYYFIENNLTAEILGTEINYLSTNNIVIYNNSPKYTTKYTVKRKKRKEKKSEPKVNILCINIIFTWFNNKHSNSRYLELEIVWTRDPSIFWGSGSGSLLTKLHFFWCRLCILLVKRFRF